MTQRQTFSMLYHIEAWAMGTRLSYVYDLEYDNGMKSCLPYVYRDGLYHYFALRPDNKYHLIMTSTRDLGETQ
jgi:hypothetical protein